jgi:hypothetical protein
MCEEKDERPARLRGALPLLMAALTFVYIYFFQYYEKIPNPNEQTRAYLTIALVERGTIAIDDEIKRFGDTIDKAWFGGRTLCDKAPGLSFLGVPVYAGLKAMAKVVKHDLKFAEIIKVLRVFSVTLPALLLLLLIYRGLGMVEPDDRVRLPLLAAYALGTTAHTYSVLLFSHQVAAGLTAAAFFLAMSVARTSGARMSNVQCPMSNTDSRLTTDDSATPPAPSIQHPASALADSHWQLATGNWPLVSLAAGLCAGFAVVCEYPLIIAAAIIAGYVVFTSWRRPLVLVSFALGALVPAAALLAYNKAAFGGYFELGYAHIANPFFAQFHKDGALGVSTPKLAAFGGSFFSASRGYFPFQPWLFLAFPGIYYLFRQRNLRAEGIAVVAAAIGYAYFISSFSYWQAGGTVSQRHLTALTPFLLVPLAVFAREIRAEGMGPLRYVYAAAGLFSILVITFCTVPFPFFSTAYPNPLFDLAFRLWNMGLVPHSVGEAMGIPGLWAAVPFLLVITLVAAFFLRESFGSVQSEWRRRAGVLASVAIVFLVLAAYSLVERDRNLEGKRNDMWGIVGNYEPREGICDLATKRDDKGAYLRSPDDLTRSCHALLGHTADALDEFRKQK